VLRTWPGAFFLLEKERIIEVPRRALCRSTAGLELQKDEVPNCHFKHVQPKPESCETITGITLNFWGRQQLFLLISGLIQSDYIGFLICSNLKRLKQAMEFNPKHLFFSLMLRCCKYCSNIEMRFQMKVLTAVTSLRF